MLEKYKIHAFYILSILTAVIIGLITIKWSQIPNLPELITFALTITSLVLALLAIIYAYVTNFSFQQTTGALTKAAEDVVASAVDVRKATEELGSHVKGIPPLLTSVGKGFEETQALLKQYSAKEASPPAEAEPATANSDELGNRFFTTSSVTGLFGLLAFKHALRTRKPLNLEKYADHVHVGSADYLYGYFVAGASAGVLMYSGRADSITPEELNPVISDRLDNDLLKKIEALETNTEHRTRLLSAIESTRMFFEAPPAEAVPAPEKPQQEAPPRPS